MRVLAKPPGALCVLLIGLASLIATAFAQSQVVIYRCTDAAGSLTIQNNVPCPKGSKQERRLLDASVTVPEFSPRVLSSTPAVAPPPPPATSAPPRAPAPIDEVSTTADADRLPPPTLFECRTYDNGRYLSDTGNPPPRCAPLQTTGLGGSSNFAAGAACEMKTDQCQRMTDETVCEGWRQRYREAQSQLRFGVVENREAAQADVERISRIVRESTCGKR